MPEFLADFLYLRPALSKKAPVAPLKNGTTEICF
jgi:hypothetical protein